MKKLVAAVFLTAICICSIAQKSPVKFGEIPKDDLTMVVYEKDSSAAALVLSDFGKITFTFPYFTYERHLRIKILKTEGMRWADGAIPLRYTRSEGANQLTFKASTYNLENGKLVETIVSSDDMFKEKYTQDLKVKKFTFPNAKVGSIIEYSYSVKASGIPPWEFQETIPTRMSEFWAIIPTTLTIKNFSQGYVPATDYEVKESAAANTYHWIFKDVPAFKSEPLVACEEDFKGKINFYLTHTSFSGYNHDFMGSWSKINETMLKDGAFGELIKGSVFLKSVTEKVVGNSNDASAKLQAIYNYVKGHYEWNKRQVPYSFDLDDAFEKRSGSVGDINLTLASMLQKAGLKVNMVLISTRENGIIRKEVPYAYQFNYVVCAVTLENRIILLDATEKYLPLGYLPSRCINGDGFMVDANQYMWIPTDFLPVTKTTINANFTLEEESTNGDISFVRDGYDALKFRKEYAEKGKERFVQDLMITNDWEFEKSEFEKIDELSEPTKEKYSITNDKLSTKANSIIYIDPLAAGQLKENPFSENERKYPISYPSTMERVYVGKINIPDNFVVDELPKGIIISLENKSAKFTYSVTQLGNTISIYSNFKIAKTVFVQSEYLQLKEFYSQVISKQAEQIVLKRK